MFKHFRAGEAAFFCNVSDEEHWHSALFCEAEQRSGTFAYLTCAAGRRFEGICGYSLNRVDNKYFGLYVIYVAEYVFKPCLAYDEQIVASSSDAVGTKFELGGAFLALHVEYPFIADCKQILQHKRGFAYAGLTAYEYNRAFDNTAAKHAVELFAGHVQSRFVDGLNLIDRPRNTFGAERRRRGIAGR